MRKNTGFLALPILLLMLGLGASRAQTNQPTDSLGGRTVHVFLPSSAIDTLVIQNLNIRMKQDAKYWYSYTFTKAGLYDYQDGFYFTDVSHRIFFSKAGMGGTEAPRFLLADFQGAKEIWIVVDPAGPPTAKPVILLSPPRMVNILNPWFTTGPKMVAGTKSYGMSVVEKHCGWFSAMLLDTTITAAHFSEVNNTETYGKSGLGKTDDFDLAALFAANGPDIYLNTNTNAWTAVLPPNTDQECGYLMAATVRDFSGTNADFDFGSSITGDFSAKGIVNKAIGPDPLRHPVRSATAGTVKGLNIFNDFDSWWVTSDPSAPAEKRNYESCVDIPMSKTSDGLWEYDSYKDSPDHGFWPLEGKANPFSDSKASCYVKPPPDSTTWVMNGPSRDGNFCMESHATFIYNKGQKFAFRGDDDVWVFINGQLVVDLGGIHTPLSDSVDLDKLGLTEGNTYKWDFFYCDRQPCGSSLRVKTSIFFKQQKSLYGKDVAGPTPGSHSLELWKLSGGKGSCASIADTGITETKATGLNYRVIDAAGTVVGDLGDGSKGTYNGGIFINTATSIMAVDSEKVTGLAPGKYKLIAFEPSNQNLHVDIPFTIPFHNLVEFVSPAAPVSVPVGTLVRVIAENMEKDSLVAAAEKYTPAIPTGLEVYQDSLRTKPVAAGTELTTEATGYDTLWVTGTATATTDKTYILSIPNSTRTVTVTFVVPKNRVEFEPPFTRDSLVGQVLAIDLSNKEAGAVVAAAKAFTLVIPAGLKVYSDPAGTAAITGGTTGADGKIRIYATADSTDPVDKSYVLAIAGTPQTLTLNFHMPPLDLPKLVSAGIYDGDGDGIGDRIEAVFDRDIAAAAPKQVAYQWPASATAVTVAGAQAAAGISGKNLDIGGTFSPAVLTAGTGTFKATYQARKEESVLTAPIDDHIGPIIQSAEIALGLGQDTLRIRFSEAISASGPTGDPASWFGLKRETNGQVEHVAPLQAVWKDDRSEVTLIYDNTSASVPRAGNLVRIEDGPGLIADERGNTSGPAARFRAITGDKRAEIKTVTYRVVSPQAGALPVIEASWQPTTATVEQVVAQTDRMGHLLKVDLGAYAVGDDFNPVDPSQVVLEYTVRYFTNLGEPVAEDHRSIACNDPLYQGDCRAHPGFIFVGWNQTASNGAKAATGAYAVRMQFVIKVPGKPSKSQRLDQVWGILRKR